MDGPSNTGIEVMTSHANRFVRNRVIDGRLHGFDVSQSDRNVFIKNFMDGNDGEGLTLGDSDRNWLKGNHVLRGMRQGFNVGGGSPDNHFIGNRVEMNDVGGFNIGSGSNNRLIANLAIRNGNDGILTLEPTTFLQFNLLLRNDDLGVSAPSGAIDGGGTRCVRERQPHAVRRGWCASHSARVGAEPGLFGAGARSRRDQQARTGAVRCRGDACVARGQL